MTERPIQAVADAQGLLDKIVSDALSTLPATSAKFRDDNFVEIEFDVHMRVTAPARTEDSLAKFNEGFFDDRTTADAMGPKCCVCVFYQNGSWYCQGTCCPDVTMTLES